MREYTLFTFDVDGTLVKGSGDGTKETAHAKSFSIGVGTVLSTKPTAPVAKVLPRTEFHGSTDGLIALRLAKRALDIPSSQSFPKLQEIMNCMFQHINQVDDDVIAKGINVLPGVMKHLQVLKEKENIMCGLVTGNVEGIARRKMKAVGIYQLQTLSPPSPEQLTKKWGNTDDIAFLGGFGSDYCSGDIEDLTRNYLDRGEQIAICAKRCQEMLKEKEEKLVRVIHVGDAPADVLAAKAFADKNDDHGLCVGMAAVATGSYSAQELKELFGERDEGRWEPIVFENGMGDDLFLEKLSVL